MAPMGWIAKGQARCAALRDADGVNSVGRVTEPAKLGRHGALPYGVADKALGRRGALPYGRLIGRIS